MALEEMGRTGDLSAAESTLEQTAAAVDAVESELIKRFGRGVLPMEGSPA